MPTTSCKAVSSTYLSCTIKEIILIFKTLKTVYIFLFLYFAHQLPSLVDELMSSVNTYHNLMCTMFSEMKVKDMFNNIQEGIKVFA